MEATIAEPIAVEPKAPARDFGRATREGLKGLIKIQNVLLDFAAEQNAIAFKMVRERVNAAESSPATSLIDSVEEVFEGVVAMQKSLLDLGTQRIDKLPVEVEKDSQPEKEKRAFPRLPFGEMLRKNFEATVEAQREILALIEKQGKLGVEAVDEFTRFTAGKTLKHLAAKAKEGVDNVIDTQSRLVELAARQGKDSVETLANQETAALPKDIARHIEEGINNLRRTQEKLLDMAGELNERTYGETEPSEEEVEASTLAKQLSHGIERVVKAQNELLDASLRAVNRTSASEA